MDMEIDFKGRMSVGDLKYYLTKFPDFYKVRVVDEKYISPIYSIKHESSKSVITNHGAPAPGQKIPPYEDGCTFLIKRDTYEPIYKGCLILTIGDLLYNLQYFDDKLDIDCLDINVPEYHNSINGISTRSTIAGKDYPYNYVFLLTKQFLSKEKEININK